MKNILTLIYSIMFGNMISYAVDGGAGGSDDGGSDSDGGQDGGDDGGDSDGDGNGSDEGKSGDSDGKSDKDDPAKKGDSPEAKRKRWLISQGKEAARKSAENRKGPDGGGGKSNAALEELMKDADFSAMMEDFFETKISQYSDKFEKVGELDTRFQRQDFFDQFTDAGEPFKAAGLNVNPQEAGTILADIEQNGMTPEMLILLSNKDVIFDKLKLLPREAMETDSGKSPENEPKAKDMLQRAGQLRKKFLG